MGSIRKCIRKRTRHCGRYGVSSEFCQVSYFPYVAGKETRSRQRKYQTSVPKQKRLNNKKARRYLEALLCSNFGRGDLLLSLSYAPEHAPENEQEAKREFANFMRRVNYQRKKRGLPIAKWISVTEISRNGRIHHHVVMDHLLDRDTVEGIWKHGFANTKKLRPDAKRGLLPVADYIAKTFKDNGKKKNMRKWDCSKNLIRPWDTVNDDPRMMSQKKIRLMQDLPEDSEEMKQLIELDNPGYELLDVEREYREETGEYYYFCRMRLSTRKREMVDKPE